MRKHHNKRFGLRLIVLFLSFFLLSSCGVKNINFISEKYTASVGDQIILDYVTDPEDKKAENVRIEFDDGSYIQTKEDGTIIALKEGSVSASLIYKDKTYDTTQIIINPILCKEISSGDYAIGVGRETAVEIDYYPNNCTHKDYTLISSDENIFKTYGNKIIAVAEGEGDLIVQSEDGPETSVKVSVFAVEPDEIQILGTNIKYIVGDTDNLSVLFDPSDVTYKDVKWTSTNNSILSIDQEGKLSAKKPGKVTISVKYSDTVFDSKEIEVKYPAVSTIELNANYSTIYTDDKLRVRATLYPEKVDDNSITWTSSNEKIAKVSSDGVVTALAEGSVTIYATSSNGKKASYKVTIEKRPTSTADNTRSTGTTYILNTNTKKFHYSWCSSVKQMKESNKKYSDADRDTIIGWGYVPCKKCNP